MSATKMTSEQRDELVAGLYEMQNLSDGMKNEWSEKYQYIAYLKKDLPKRLRKTESYGKAVEIEHSLITLEEHWKIVQQRLTVLADQAEDLKAILEAEEENKEESGSDDEEDKEEKPMTEEEQSAFMLENAKRAAKVFGQEFIFGKKDDTSHRINFGETDDKSEAILKKLGLQYEKVTSFTGRFKELTLGLELVVDDQGVAAILSDNEMADEAISAFMKKHNIVLYQ
jgi:hypothetical protein